MGTCDKDVRSLSPINRKEFRMGNGRLNLICLTAIAVAAIGLSARLSFSQSNATHLLNFA